MTSGPAHFSISDSIAEVWLNPSIAHLILNAFQNLYFTFTDPEKASSG